VAVRSEAVTPTWRDGRVTSWLTTLDHKRIGILYIVTSLAFFLLGGILALLIRTQLITPDTDIFARDTLDFLSREIATVGALSSLEGVNPMLRFHMGAAMNVGLTENQAKELVALIGSEVGKKAGDNAGEVLQQVLDSRAK